MASSVSADGSVVVGWSATQSGNMLAFRWTDNQMQSLGTIRGNAHYWAYSVSANGSVVVGVMGASTPTSAFRWANNQMQTLGTISGAQSIWAYSVSADGSVVVGWFTKSNGQSLAFRKAGNVTQNLGALGDNQSSWAYDVSGNGSVVVGAVKISDNRNRAFRWTQTNGMQDLNTIYATLLSDGSTLEQGSAISPDGRYIVGRGYNSTSSRVEAFLLDTWREGDTNGDGCIDDADLLAVLFAFGTTGTGYTRHEDINKDGIVDDADLLMVLFNFGMGC